jgi:competence protein ComEC
VVTALAFSAGIALDRLLSPAPGIWFCTAALMLGGAWIASRTGRVRWTSLLVLLSVLMLGGERHSLAWNVRPSGDVSRICTPAGVPVRVIGTISCPVEIREAKVGPEIPAWLEMDRSICTLDCEQVASRTGRQAVTGRIRLEITGHLVHAGAGDRVEVLGRLQMPGPPLNPGSFDYRIFLRSQGLSGILRAEHPVAIRKIEARTAPVWQVTHWRSSARKACGDLFASQLPEAPRALALSLLLGDRTLLEEDVQKQFGETGTMHLLAISGLNVGILVGLLLIFCRLANLSSGTTALCLLVSIACYAFITDHRPPVLRAALLASIAIHGVLRGSRINSWNSLAVCALILLLWHPADLFDVGAQLSFLAVGAILWSGEVLHWLDSKSEPNPLAMELSPVRTRLRQTARTLAQFYLVTAIVWAATLPLTMFVFHYVSPVGMLLNLVLIPYTTAVLMLGYLYLICGLLLPPLAGILAVPFSWSLSLFLAIVRWGHTIPLGHFSVAQIPLWWVIGFYLCLALVWRLIRPRMSERWPAALLLCWTILGAAWPFWPHRETKLRCTLLAVGHGLATVLELPSGEVLLYDAGNIGDGGRAERTVSNYLWFRGHGRIDSAMISHADHDHFSGMHGLLPIFRPRTLFFPQSFLDFNQRNIAALCESAREVGTDLRVVQAGDKIVPVKQTALDLSLQILHPPGNQQFKTDNANSLVLLMTFAGRRILLTGDLELDGLQHLLSQPPVKADVILAPHHGGKAANLPQLYRWANPRFVVVSSSEAELPRLAEIVEPARLFNTAAVGAVTIEIERDGRMQVATFVQPAEK